MVEPALPNAGQLALVGLAGACFAAAAIGAIRPMAHPAPESPRILQRGLSLAGIALALAALIWHSAARGSWLPLEDNFEALVWLGLLLAILDVYLQARRRLVGLDAFVLPIVVLLLAGADIFGRMRPHAYVDSAWSLLHQATAYLGAAAFAVACAIGALYLIASQRLRNKSALPGARLGNLERLEHRLDWAVTLGFALLTIALITGLVKVLAHGGDTALGKNWIASPKVLLAFSVWFIYALTLHTPISPSIRGRRAAVMSIVGFVLMIGSLVAAQFMPGGSR